MRAPLLSLTLLTLVFTATSAAFAADWPQWLGPTRNGATSETVAVWVKPPTALWRQSVGNGYSSPIVSDGIAVVHAAASGKNAETVSAFDAKTGKPLWSDTYDRQPYRSPFGSGPRTTPTIVGGKLFTYGITGVLSCYELKTGKRLWQANPYETFKVSLPRWAVCSSPVVVEGRVVTLVGGSGSAVVAFDAETGEVAWNLFDEPASSASPAALTLGEGDKQRTEVVVQTTLRTLGLNPKDGAIRWEHPIVFHPAGVSPTPLVIGSSIVCTTQQTGTLALDFSSDGGKPRSAWWKNDLVSYFSTGTVGPKGTVIVVTNQETPVPRADIRCLDLAKGEELWRKEGLGYYHIGLITTGDGKLLGLDDGGNLMLAEATNEGFKQLAKSNVCRGTMANPALSGGCVFVRDDKELICLQLNASADEK